MVMQWCNGEFDTNWLGGIKVPHLTMKVSAAEMCFGLHEIRGKSEDCTASTFTMKRFSAKNGKESMKSVNAKGGQAFVGLSPNKKWVLL